MCDNGKTCLVYVGKKASIEERRKGMEYAHVSRFGKYLSFFVLFVFRLVPLQRKELSRLATFQSDSRLDSLYQGASRVHPQILLFSVSILVLRVVI